MRAIITDLLGIHDDIVDPVARKHIGQAITRMVDVHLNCNPNPRDCLTIVEEELLKAGKKISAIKSVRARLGLRLKESKELVEGAGIQVPS
jgi:ribosomal protein L7/L12